MSVNQTIKKFDRQLRAVLNALFRLGGPDFVHSSSLSLENFHYFIYIFIVFWCDSIPAA